MKKKLLMLSATFLCLLHAMAQKGSRVTGESSSVFFQGSLLPRDTTNYTYNKPGVFDTMANLWRPDTTLIRKYNGTSIVNLTRISNTFNALQQVTERRTDFWDATYWRPQQRSIFTYIPQGTVATDETQLYDGTNFYTNNKITYTYDAQGRPIERIDQANSGSGLQNFTREVTTYNTQGSQDTLTRYTWLVPPGQWDPVQRVINYYNSTALTIQVTAALIVGVWTDTDSILYTRDNNGNITVEEGKKLSGGVWKNLIKILNDYDAAGNKTSSIVQVDTSGSFQYISQTATTYNSFEQPTSITFKSWEPGTNSFVFKDGDGLRVLTYEEIETSITAVVPQTGSVHLYPLPAKNALSLRFDGNDTQPSTITLFDMTGKVAGQWSIPTVKQHTQKLDISNIPSGTYMLKVMGTKGTLSQQVNIVK